MNDKLFGMLLDLMKLFMKNNDALRISTTPEEECNEIVMIACKQNIQDSQEKNTAMRVYLEEEKSILSSECRGYLYQIEQHGLISPVLRELIIHKLMNTPDVDLDLYTFKQIINRIVENIADPEITGISHTDWISAGNDRVIVH